MNKLSRLERRYDSVIIGARCAGAATALLLARAGAKVLVVDRQAYGSDTMSTHALMRGAVLQLNRWGLTKNLVAEETPAIHSTSFHYGNEQVRVTIKAEHGVDCLLAPRRTVLDRLLVDAAANAGAEVRHGVALSGLLLAPDGRVIGVSLTDADGAKANVHAGIVIGADGRQSSVAQQVGAKTYIEGSHAAGLAYGYFDKLPQDGFHWHYTKGAAAGMIPTNRCHCVFAAVPASQFFTKFRGDTMRGFLEVLEANSPALRSCVERGMLIGRLRGFAGAPGYLRQCQGPGWALVGDAGYFKDPLTAHGITDALRDAELLSRAIVAGSAHALALYQHERDALSLLLLRITDKLASFSWDHDGARLLHADMSTLMKVETNHLASLSESPLLAA